MRDGLRPQVPIARPDEFDKARDKFAEARLDFDKQDAAKAAIAAFDEACASHRKGDVEHAREWYLKAGLAHDKRLAAAAHFNLGTLAAEEARRLAGERPEDVPPDKRPEILDQLKGAVASFRHSLELQPDNSRARRDIELVRMWIKYYTDKWHERDRQKRRQETNLVAFLEFLIETQRTLRESVKTLPAAASADVFAELKRVQDELHDEISPLKGKIRADLAPQQPAAATVSAPQPNSNEIEQGIALLQTWADAAGEKMSSAASHLDARSAAPAADDQQSAIDELEKIWEAVIPFQALLERDLADQSQIAQTLAPAPPADSKSAAGDEPSGETDPHRDESKPTPKGPPPAAGQAALGSEREDLLPLAETQERTAHRTQLLKLKAEAELTRMEKSPPSDAEPKGPDPATTKDDPKEAAAAKPKPVDPKLIKAGYQKAIDLAPRAAAQMEKAVKSLKQKEPQAAYTPAEEARKILEEIQKAQPKQEQQDQKQQDQKKNEDQKTQDVKDQQKNDQQKKDEQKKDQQKKDQQKDDREKTTSRRKDQEKKKEDSGKPAKQKQNQKQPDCRRSPLRSDRRSRKVRERQQEKRERDRKMKARVIGRVPVEKDW